MARAFWKGAISFGMVMIPVKMYVATETRTLSMHVLHQKCLTRPKQVWYCPMDEEYFRSEDTVRGYEFTKDQYVVLEEDDFRKVPVKTTHTIDIVGFVDASEIDPVYYHGSHYLEPEEIGVKPFILLGEALRKTGRIGLAKVAVQRREHLCCVRPFDDVLALHTLHFQNEIVPPPVRERPKQHVAAGELDMAVTLINAMAKKFAPGDYADDYAQALKAVIEAKISGREIKAPKAARVEAFDLMSALKASIEATKKTAGAK